MITEIIKELITIEKTNEITSKQVLGWTRRVEAQRVQKAVPEATKESKDFDAVKTQEQQTIF